MPLLRRPHFYAGVLVAPFLVVAALSGLLYALAPRLDTLLYDDVLKASSTDGAPRPVSEEVATAQVQGQLTTWSGSTPVTTWLDNLHRRELQRRPDRSQRQGAGTGDAPGRRRGRRSLRGAR
ncbi:PepSY domain-containing protein [Saccharothrix lopnurensis]|uniref:PepSY domain-containing protein n=1 Tax=Saccharothrix lopnurensis TaxID=1670621 RepID=A0ABW1P8L1_9PSEU